MSEAAPANTPVAGESTIESKANSSVTFSDLEQMDQAEQRAKRETKAEDKPKDESGTRRAEREDKSEKRNKDDKKESKGREDKSAAGRDDDDSAEKEKPESKPKPKVHKFRSGEDEHALGGDSVVSVVVDGKKEEVPLQELINNYSGKVGYDRKFSELAAEKKAHEKTVAAMDSMVKNLFEKAQKNPEDAWDFLAELTGKDPVEFKADLLRKQRAEALRLAEMSDEDFEKYLKDASLSWRERRLERKDSETKAAREQAEREQKTAEMRKQYGISDDRYESAHKIAKDYLKGQEPTPDQVLYAERYITALETIRESVPALESHDKFDNIVEDIVQDMLRHPSMTRDKLQALLLETWGEDKSALKRLSEKIRRDPEAEELPRGREKKSEAVFFSDL